MLTNSLTSVDLSSKLYDRREIEWHYQYLWMRVSENFKMYLLQFLTFDLDPPNPSRTRNDEELTSK